MAIRKELWVSYLVANLFKDQAFFNYCKREDEFVLNGAVVHIPQAGAKPTVVKNRSTLPATVIKRTDTDIVYLLDEFSSDPTLISLAEQYEESPEKMGNVLGEHVETLRENIGDELIFNWLSAFAASGAGSPSAAIAAAPMLRTSGAAVANHMPGSATGNRKLFVKEDLLKAKTLMNKQNVPKGERYALFSSELLDQLNQDPDIKNRVLDRDAEPETSGGSLVRIYGFNILERSYTATYSNTAIKAIGANTAATDNDVVVCWQRNSVALALGDVDVLEEKRSPIYYGDIYSAVMRAGGRKTRRNAEGVVAIVQDASA
jgi:hypothetical protein